MLVHWEDVRRVGELEERQFAEPDGKVYTIQQRFSYLKRAGWS